MNKRLSKVALGLVTCAMIVTTITLCLANKDKSKVVDIYGDREVLGDVSIIYQERQGYYKTKEVKVTKDDLKVDGFAKEVPSGYTVSNFTKENRNLLQNRFISPSYDTLHQDDETIGFVEISRDYNSVTKVGDKVQNIAYVTEKNLKNNNIKKYEIPLDFYEDDNVSTDTSAVSMKYNDELYLIMGYDHNSNYIENGKSAVEATSDSVYGSKESGISVFKLDLEKKGSEHVFTKKIGKEDEITKVSNNVAFTYKDTTYILSYRYKLNEENKYDRITSLLTYNASNGKFNAIDLPMNIEDSYSVYRYALDNNILTLIAKGEDNYGKASFYTTKVNLDTNEIVNNSEKYELSIDDDNDFFSLSINDFRLIDNKIYLTIGAYEDPEATKSDTNIDKRYVVVLDEKSKETLYIGKLSETTNGYIYPTIVTKEEL